MTTDQLTTANAMPLPDTLTDEQQARAAALHQARILLAPGGPLTNTMARRFGPGDLMALAGFILDGAVTTLEVLDVIMDGDGNTLARSVAVDLDDLRTIVEYVGRQLSNDEADTFPAAYQRLAQAVGEL